MNRTGNPFDELYRETLRFWLRAGVFTLFCASLMVASGAALGAPRAGSAEECAGIADMAITARAMAEEGVSRERALKVLARMYPTELLVKWHETLLGAAFSDKRAAKEFAGALLKSCYQGQGVVDGFFGTGV
jgi:hypothetical protein